MAYNEKVQVVSIKVEVEVEKGGVKIVTALLAQLTILVFI